MHLFTLSSVQYHRSYGFPRTFFVSDAFSILFSASSLVANSLWAFTCIPPPVSVKRTRNILHPHQNRKNLPRSKSPRSSRSLIYRLLSGSFNKRTDRIACILPVFVNLIHRLALIEYTFYYDTIFLTALQAIFHYKKYKKRFWHTPFSVCAPLI